MFSVLLIAIMPRCMVHRRHTAVCSCVGASVCQILYSSMSNEVEMVSMLKVIF